MDKRRLAYNLILAGVGFVAVFHIVFSQIFQYGLTVVGVALLVIVAAGGLIVNL
jgi:hypothetical protein